MTVAVINTSRSSGRRPDSSSAPARACTPKSTAFSMKILFASPKSVSFGYFSSGKTRWRLLTLALACSWRTMSS
ncbi:Uncharacterised protein [Mycobacterium tuberculosis]|uniref:Uncharacterized protein n=2 Tax=Mycobacterium tuberculosis TaxID=1773 RepID=A0A655G001_MYCTX|nr:Uncharacterised protein [Mycobacterium tuberculosis]CKQ27997.1 Uncharacterised protein [Mycobacterium tuberculosis]CKV08918.1 Uncharacterised protein [Mycobacterium tuberculosis]CNX01329.1 Uncharacterised protein [Mycobacterium tuberculosis]COX02348.1 Uncharacterised protein [Mycobacterium tuberculosis]